MAMRLEKRNKKLPTDYDSIRAPLRQEIFKHFGRITITLGAPAYGIIFHMKVNSVLNILACLYKMLRRSESSLFGAYALRDPGLKKSVG